MLNQKRMLVSYLILALMLVAGCDSSDDNNPSPVPDARNKFVGSWSVNNESCVKQKYLVTISVDPSNSSQVLLYNFGFSNAGQPDIAIVAGNSIQVYKQTNSEGWTIEGSGNYTTNGEINWTYSLLISGTLEQCSCTYVKN